MTSYAEVASSPGAWVCPVVLPTPTHLCHVRSALTTVAFMGYPIAAALFGYRVRELLLYRDPSKTYGTPSPEMADEAAEILAELTGWVLAPEWRPRTGVVVGLGLREGYAPDAPRHQPAEVEAQLSQHGVGWRCGPARLVSARTVHRTVRWYAEVGVVVEAPVEMQPLIARIAGDLKQDRYVVTDFTGQHTTAFERDTGTTQ